MASRGDLRRPRPCAPLDRLDRLARGDVLDVDAPVLVARRARSRARPSCDSEIDGIPASPSSAETSPSCITPVARQRRVLLVQREHAAGAAAGTGAPGASRRRRATGSPSSVKPAAPASRELGHLGQLARPPGPRVIAARKPTGIARLARARARAASAAPARESTTGSVFGMREDRAEAAGRRGARAGVEVLLVLAPGRAQVHVRVDEGGERVQALGRRPPRRPSGALERPARRSRRSRPSRTSRSRAPVEPRARVEQRARRGSAASRPAPASAVQLERAAHAGCGSRRLRRVDRRAPRGAPPPPASSS